MDSLHTPPQKLLPRSQPDLRSQFDKPHETPGAWFNNPQVKPPLTNSHINTKPSGKTVDSQPAVTGTSDYGQDQQRNMVVNTVANPRYICKQLKVPDCCDYISDPKLRQDCVDQWKTICKPT